MHTAADRHLISFLSENATACSVFHRQHHIILYVIIINNNNGVLIFERKATNAHYIRLHCNALHFNFCENISKRVHSQINSILKNFLLKLLYAQATINKVPFHSNN